MWKCRNVECRVMECKSPRLDSRGDFNYALSNRMNIYRTTSLSLHTLHSTLYTSTLHTSTSPHDPGQSRSPASKTGPSTQARAYRIPPGLSEAYTGVAHPWQRPIPQGMEVSTESWQGSERA